MTKSQLEGSWISWTTKPRELALVSHSLHPHSAALLVGGKEVDLGKADVVPCRPAERVSHQGVPSHHLVVEGEAGLQAGLPLLAAALLMVLEHHLVAGVGLVGELRVGGPVGLRLQLFQVLGLPVTGGHGVRQPVVGLGVAGEHAALPVRLLVLRHHL